MIVVLLLIVAGGLLLFAFVSKGSTGPTAKRRAQPIDYDLIRHRWSEIERASHSGGLGLKGAISEADKLLDYVMKQQGYGGDTMAERLKRAQGRLHNREAVWQAHKLRNHLTHEAGFESSSSQAKEAIAAYRRALEDLGALQ